MPNACIWWWVEQIFTIFYKYARLHSPWNYRHDFHIRGNYRAATRLYREWLQIKHHWIFSLRLLEKYHVSRAAYNSWQYENVKDGLYKYSSHLCKRKEPSQNGLDYVCTCGDINWILQINPKIMTLYDLVWP